MSSPHVIVSAVHDLNEDPKAFWKDEHIQNVLTDFDEEVWDDEWYMCSGTIQIDNESYPVLTPHHSNREGTVVEVVFAGQEDMQDISLSGVEELLYEVNMKFNIEFTLETYYWYDGTDKPGGTDR